MRSTRKNTTRGRDKGLAWFALQDESNEEEHKPEATSRQEEVVKVAKIDVHILVLDAEDEAKEQRGERRQGEPDVMTEPRGEGSEAEAPINKPMRETDLEPSGEQNLGEVIPVATAKAGLEDKGSKLRIGKPAQRPAHQILSAKKGGEVEIEAAHEASPTREAEGEQEGCLDPTELFAGVKTEYVPRLWRILYEAPETFACHREWGPLLATSTMEMLGLVLERLDGQSLMGLPEEEWVKLDQGLEDL